MPQSFVTNVANGSIKTSYTCLDRAVTFNCDQNGSSSGSPKVWRALLTGISFLALILLSSKLYDVHRQILYLKHVSTHWFPSNSNKTDISVSNGTNTLQVANFKHDIELLIIELWSARTTLVLSVIFVIVYIFSWTWMAYAAQQSKLSKKMSIKTMLVLTIFAAIDIAASTGFIIIRLIMYTIRNQNFPNDLRIPSFDDQDESTALLALRITMLQSSSGTTDVFVSSIIGFLTFLRLYSIVCAISFYKNARRSKSKRNDIIQQVENGSGNFGGENCRSHQEISDFFKGSSLVTPKDPSISIKDRNSCGESRPNLSTSVVPKEENWNELKIQAADMPLQMQKMALESASEAIRLYSSEKHIAESIKQDFDRAFEPNWHCIVGRNWGSCVTHSKQCYIRMINKEFTILLYKAA